MDFSDFFDIDEASLWLEPDTVLANVITAIVNMMGMPIGVTLFVKGVVLSGTLVSEREYLEKLTEVFQSAAKQSMSPSNEEEKEIIEDIFDFTKLRESNMFDDPEIEVGEDDDPVADDEELDDEDLALSPYIRYLHLKDFSVLTPNPPITFSGSSFPILRLRLTSIDGWMLGQATPIDFEQSFTDNPDKGEILH